MRRPSFVETNCYVVGLLTLALAWTLDGVGLVRFGALNLFGIGLLASLYLLYLLLYLGVWAAVYGLMNSTRVGWMLSLRGSQAGVRAVDWLVLAACGLSALYAISRGLLLPYNLSVIAAAALAAIQSLILSRTTAPFSRLAE